MAHRLWDRRRASVLVVLVAAWMLVGCNGTPPTGAALGQIEDQATTLGEPVTVPLTIVSDQAGTLTVTATSSDEQVLPQSGIQVIGSGTDRSLRLSPSHEKTGSTTVTVVAQDAGGQSSREFSLVVSVPFVNNQQVLETKTADPIGVALDIDGETIVAGGIEKAWSFVLDGESWVEDQAIVPLDNENYVEEGFGSAVALEGDRLMIGAPDTSGGFADQGLAYLFERSTTGFSQVTFFADNDPSSQELLGRSVGVVGDHVFAGVPGGTVAGIESGAVSAFQRDPGGDWSLLGKLTPSDATTGTVFGEAIDASEGLLVIGDYANDERGTDAGAAYVFESDGGFWSEADKLAPEDLEAQDQFGVAVAGDGDWVLVSAWNDDGQGENAGAVYVFHREGGTWQQVDVLYSPDPEPEAGFGSSLALQYPYAVVSAKLENSGANNAGAVYVLRHDGTTWHAVAKLTSPDPAADASFGWDVGISGDYLVASQFSPALTVVFRR